MPLSQRRTARRDRGISSVEYALAAAGVAGLLSVAVMGLGGQLASIFQCMATQLNGPMATCTNLSSPGGATDEGGSTQAGTPGGGDSGNDGTTGGGSGDGDTVSGTPTTDPTSTPSPSASPSPTTETPSPTTPSPTTPTPTTPSSD